MPEYECSGCGDKVPQDDGPPQLPCLNCGAQNWEEVTDGA